MAYRVQVEGKYETEVVYDEEGKGHIRQKNEDAPAIFYYVTFTNEGEAREALKKYLDDDATMIRNAERFKPIYFNATILERSDQGQTWEVIYNETFVV